MNPIKSCFVSAVAIFLFVFAFATPAYSQSVSVSSGSWSNASTWNTPPVNNVQVEVSGGNTVTFGPGDSYTGSPTWFAGLGIGNSTPGTLNITGGTLTTGAWYAGHQTTATINLSGGSLIANGNQMLFGWTNTATMNITGGTMSMTGDGADYNIGHSAQSFINVSNNGVANFAGGIGVTSASQINISNNGVANFTAGMNVLNGSQINNNGGTVTINPTTQNVVQYGSSISQTAGTTTVGDNLWLGANATSGTINLSGGSWNQNGFMRWGVFGSGNSTINQTSGTFAMGSTFEVWADGTSNYNLQGGTFRVTVTNVKFNVATGVARFNITGSSGNVTVDTGANNFSAPNGSTFNNAAATLTKIGSGTLTFAGAGSQLQIVNGALDMQAGTLETQSTLSIGASNGTASGTMTGGTLRTGYLAASNFAVGNGGTGTFTQNGGTIDTGSSANTVIGWNTGGTGIYTLNGGTYSAVGNNTFIGFSGGAGTVNVNGGSFAANNLIVGGNGAASGTLNLNGGTVTVANVDGFYVSSNGTLNLNSGGSMPAATLRVTSGGRLNFNGGTGTSALNILAGGDAGGTVDLNGQTLTNSTWGNLVASGTGAVLRNSSTTAATIPGSGNVLWIWDGAQNLTIDTPAGPLAIASRITSSGQTTATGIIKTGTGTLVLSGNANDYTGSTAVNAGSLLVNGNQIGATGAMIIAANALLGGSGTIGGAVTVNGTLSPGNSPGVLSLASLVLGGSSTSLFEINGTTRGTAYDGVNITGATAPSYGGTLSLSFGNGSAFANDTIFDLFNFTGSPTGDFSSVTSTGFYAGSWTLSSGTWKLESGSQTLSFSPATGDIVVVPEPGALALAGLGIAAAAWARRSRQKACAGR
jgi:autotransporter-associated beta strand protein